MFSKIIPTSKEITTLFIGHFMGASFMVFGGDYFISFTTLVIVIISIALYKLLLAILYTDLN